MNTTNHWNYRVIQDSDGNYCIYEVYYTDGVPTSWAENPTEPFGETVQELKRDLALMISAFDRPPMKEQGGKLIEISPVQ